jgi:hypothetical protein
LLHGINPPVMPWTTPPPARECHSRHVLLSIHLSDRFIGRYVR